MFRYFSTHNVISKTVILCPRKSNLLYLHSPARWSGLQLPKIWKISAGPFCLEQKVKYKTAQFERRAAIYSSHAIGHGSMRVHGAAKRRARASEHRLGEEERDGDRELCRTKCPPNVCLLALPMNNPRIPMSASWKRRTRLPPLQGSRSPTAGCAFFFQVSPPPRRLLFLRWPMSLCVYALFVIEEPDNGP